jgi:lipopolysaccharide/colanic/teichoic acid biosynthesis glycosyltransferase
MSSKEVFEPTRPGVAFQRNPGGPPMLPLGLRAIPRPPGKWVLDLVLALVLSVLAIPVLLVVALVLKLTSRGPVLYCQTRCGKKGRPYTLFKVRSMCVGSEKNGACWSQPGDPRVTRVGRFLRKSHLDELPQLWNVLTGRMSLVGPRPERPEFVPSLSQAIHHYGDRLLVLPGVTGLAQVQLPADTSIESVRTKLAYDLWYVHNRTFLLDLAILVATGLKMVGLSARTLRRLMRFPGPATVEAAYLTLHAHVSSGKNAVIVAPAERESSLPSPGPTFAQPLFSPEQG